MTKKNQTATFKFQPFSKKQLKVLTWWMPNSPHHDKDAIICDGSVRAGKSLVMSLGFVIWAMETFSGVNLGMAGKTIGSLRRNVIGPLKQMLRSRGYAVRDHRADNYLTITRKGRSNDFYLFGGRDERSQDLIQGITLAGMLFDEVALMPESFVNQATARCSVDGAKLWFNCNPEGPFHWFKLNWLDQLEQKNALHLHFTMDDNLSLSARVRERYKRMYTGVFYKRFILGLWVLAEGIIYDMFDPDRHVIDCAGEKYEEYGVAIDYATSSVMTFGLYGHIGDKVYLVREYYWDAKAQGRQRTDVEFAADLRAFLGGITPKVIYVDPSASSFKLQLRNDGFSQVKDGINDVVSGIRLVGSFLASGRYLVDQRCRHTQMEFATYSWDPKAQDRGEDRPIKKNDHCVDRDRYYLHTRYGRRPAIAATLKQGMR